MPRACPLRDSRSPGGPIDRGAPSGPGVDAVHVSAWPVGGGSPTFLGAAMLAIVVFAHSAVAGTFNNAQTVTITVR
jgi:hypothetical protein